MATRARKIVELFCVSRKQVIVRTKTEPSSVLPTTELSSIYRRSKTYRQNFKVTSRRIGPRGKKTDFRRKSNPLVAQRMYRVQYQQFTESQRESRYDSIDIRRFTVDRIRSNRER